MDAFYALAVLACPVGMGLVMWFMMKGARQPGGTQAQRQHETTGFAGYDKDPRQQEIDALRQEIASLRAKVDSQPEAPAQERTR